MDIFKKDTPLSAGQLTSATLLSPPVSAQNATLINKSFKGQRGLYLHVPFCTSICPFCPYNKVLYEQQLAVEYFKALCKELDHYQQTTATPFSSLYIGGGTPTLCLDELKKIMEKVSVSGEIAIEVLPNHATKTNISHLKRMGVNYLSLGVQSFNQGVLDHLGRPNTATDNEAALETVQGQFDCVDVDLIFDIAFEDGSIFLSDLERCLKAGVEQVSTYPLMRFGYTPFGKSRHTPKHEHKLLHEAESITRQYGYERRSVWTFNRVDSPSYTSITREFYLGCGAGAASYTGSLFYVNHFSVPGYIQALDSGNLPIARTARLSKRKAAAYYLFWQAYTGKVDLNRFRNLYPEEQVLNHLLATLCKAGLFRQEGDVLVLTKRGHERYHDLERWVTYHFIEPLWGEMMYEHSHLQSHLPPLSLMQRLWLRLGGFCT
jgi:oxygen-independent coproporphyrinogen-3 oxidase